MSKVCYIVNPKSGFGRVRSKVLKSISYLAESGYTVKQVQTTAVGHAEELAREAALEGFDIVVAVGGDGTINEIVNGLVGTDVALGVLPAGTANAYAADVGIPLDLLKPDTAKNATNIIAQGQRRRIDLGQLVLANGLRRYFLMWSGVGLDAAISKAKAQAKTGKSRPAGYVAWIMASLMTTFDFRGVPAIIETDTEVIRERIIVAVASNGQIYGRVWRMAPEAKINDGLLDVGVMVGHGLRETIQHGIGLSLGRHVDSPNFHMHRTANLLIVTHYPMPVHVDGETIGTTPLRVEVVPRALAVIVPHNVPRRLFIDPSNQADNSA